MPRAPWCAPGSIWYVLQVHRLDVFSIVATALQNLDTKETVVAQAEKRGGGHYSSLASSLDSLLDHNSTTIPTSREVDEIPAHGNNGD